MCLLRGDVQIGSGLTGDHFPWGPSGLADSTVDEGRSKQGRPVSDPAAAGAATPHKADFPRSAWSSCRHVRAVCHMMMCRCMIAGLPHYSPDVSNDLGWS